MQKIQLKKGSSWGRVPVSLIGDMRLGHAACRLACWLATRPNNWKVWRDVAMKQCCLGQDAWKTARNQLIATGYLTVLGQSRKSGQWGALMLEFNPQPEIVDPTLEEPTAMVETACGLPQHLTDPFIGAENQAPQPQQQLKSEVVEMATDKDCGGGSDSLIWPAVVTNRGACLHAMVSLNLVQRQLLLDELQGALDAGQNISNPTGWLRKLAKLARDGHLVTELADNVVRVRAAKLAHQQRLQLNRVDMPAAGNPSDNPSQTQPLGEAAKQVRAELKRRRAQGDL